MPSSLDRRGFLQSTAAASAALGVATAAGLARGAASANYKIVVGVMGLSRGSALAAAVASLPNAEVAYLCDVDSRRLETIAKSIGVRQTRKPTGVGDFRKILDDPAVDEQPG